MSQKTRCGVAPAPFWNKSIFWDNQFMARKKTQAEVIADFQQAHGNEYDYSNVVYALSTTRVHIIHKPCGSHFWQTPKSHRLGCGCPTCSKNSKRLFSQDQVISKFKEAHGEEYDYRHVVYVNASVAVDIIHRKCGLRFKQQPREHQRGHGCPKCGNLRVKEALLHTQEQVVGAFRKVHGDAYDYSSVVYIASHEKVEIRCQCCNTTFWQAPTQHKAGKGCPRCGARKAIESRRFTQEDMLTSFRAKHGDKYDYSESVYKSTVTPVNIRCLSCNEVFTQRPAYHSRGGGCPKCSSRDAGLRCRIKLSTVIRRFRKVHGDRYNYEAVEYKGKQVPVAIGCSHHGIFYQTPASHAGGADCPQCSQAKKASSLTLPVSTVIETFREAHGDLYSYDKVQYTTTKTPVDIVCKKHGSFMQRPSDHAQGKGCPHCGHRVSSGEKELLVWIQSLGIQATGSDRTLIKPLELDIVCPEQKIAIEYNGNHWHSTQFQKNSRYHSDKLREVEQKGWRVIMIRDDEWRDTQGIVKSIIRHALGKTKQRVFARKCKVAEVAKGVFHEFADANHIQGRCAATKVIGLYYEDQLVCCGAWTKRLGLWELVRFVVKRDTVVCGGFSKLIKNFQEPFHTFCERRLFGGSGYSASGGQYISTTPPDLSYTNGIVVKNRRLFQKKIAAKWMDTYDMQLTEKVNAANNGWYQLWGCGLDKYKFNA